jgi:hypothetical protein
MTPPPPPSPLPSLRPPGSAGSGTPVISPQTSEEYPMFIGIGTLVLIVIIVLVVLFLRRH